MGQNVNTETLSMSAPNNLKKLPYVQLWNSIILCASVNGFGAMFIIKYRFFILILGLFVAFDNAAATSYCWHPYANVQNGSVTTVEWKMTSSSARKVIPPNEKVLEWCGADWSGLGPHTQPIEIVVKPKLNEAKIISYYRINYHPKKVGADEFAVKIYWLNRNNEKHSGTVIYKVTVVESEL